MDEDIQSCSMIGRKRGCACVFGIAGWILLGLFIAVIVVSTELDEGIDALSIDAPRWVNRVLCITFLLTPVLSIIAIVCGLVEGAIGTVGRARLGSCLGCLCLLAILLLAIALPGYLPARRMSQRRHCTANLRSIHSGIEAYLNDCSTSNIACHIHMTNLVPRYIATMLHCSAAKDKDYVIIGGTNVCCPVVDIYPDHAL